MCTKFWTYLDFKNLVQSCTFTVAVSPGHFNGEETMIGQPPVYKDDNQVKTGTS